MSERTQNTPGTDTPRAFGWCSWHAGYSEGVRLVVVYEQGSGSGGHVFACGPCRKEHGLVPFADQP